MEARKGPEFDFQGIARFARAAAEQKDGLSREVLYAAAFADAPGFVQTVRAARTDRNLFVVLGLMRI